MPNSTALQKLRQAVEEEQSSIKEQLSSYLALLEKMNAYQNGTGPAPSGIEFEEWRESVALVKQLRELDALPPGARPN